MGATWYFASAENRDRFAADPERYVPQYGGYCAWAVAHGYTAKIDPEAWKIVDGKLYLNYSKDVQGVVSCALPGPIGPGRRKPCRMASTRPLASPLPNEPELP
jgi:YHS domain